jgi:hypothetical protein
MRLVVDHADESISRFPGDDKPKHHYRYGDEISAETDKSRGRVIGKASHGFGRFRLGCAAVSVIEWAPARLIDCARPFRHAMLGWCFAPSFNAFLHLPTASLSFCEVPFAV